MPRRGGTPCRDAAGVGADGTATPAFLMRTSTFLVPLALAVALAGCGREPSPAGTAGAGGGAAAGLEPCGLLAPQQVATVLPDAAPGVAARSGSSLIQGIDAFQCAWVNRRTELLTVVVRVAADEARFAEIAPGAAEREDRRPVAVGEEGWMRVAPNEVKIKAVRGRTVVDVELTAPGAGVRAEALVALAQAVVARLD